MPESPQLSVSLIQTDLFWENPTANRSALEEKINLISEETDLIVLPEMFNTGFTMNVGMAEPMNLTTTRWMKQVAAQMNAMIVGSFIVKENERHYNRLCCVKPDGSVVFSDKRHLFRMGEEHQYYTRGRERLIVEWKGWKICPLVCYDLRFPVWSRNVGNAYDVLVYVANWPAKRAHAWSALLTARAIENQSYVIGVNRIGKDKIDIEYRGGSVLLDFLGEPLLNLGSKEIIGSAVLSKQSLENYRLSFPAYLDADPFHLE
jgi:omega-amidase